MYVRTTTYLYSIRYILHGTIIASATDCCVAGGVGQRESKWVKGREAAKAMDVKEKTSFFFS